MPNIDNYPRPALKENYIRLINLQVAYRKPGNCIEHLPVSFEVRKEGNFIRAIPICDEQRKRLANLPPVVQFEQQGKNVLIRRSDLKQLAKDILNKIRQVGAR